MSAIRVGDRVKVSGDSRVWYVRDIEGGCFYLRDGETRAGSTVFMCAVKVFPESAVAS